MTDYGKKIAELRAANKMTQAQLGNQLNVTSQAVSKWENGLSEPDIESIKKICEIFHISFDEFFGVEPTATTNESSESEQPTEPIAEPPVSQSTEPPAVILAYCDTCDKPMYNPKEYQVRIVNGIQHTTCLDCVSKNAAAEQKAKEQQLAERRAAERHQRWNELRKGMIWGAVGGVALALIALISGIVIKEPLVYILGTILGAYGGFALVTQMIWDNSVRDVFDFFIRTLRLPGVIFTLDIEGILFLIFVKLLGAILSAIVSVLLLLVGFFVSWTYAMIIFPFALVKQLRDIK